jgi:ligand-binding sensor domain-containing protein
MENATQIKERLHRKIEKMEDAALLKKIEDIYFSDEEGTALTDEQQKIIDADTRPYISEDEVMNIVQDREAKYFSGKDQGMSIEEFKEKFKKSHGI